MRSGHRERVEGAVAWVFWVQGLGFSALNLGFVFSGVMVT